MKKLKIKSTAISSNSVPTQTSTTITSVDTQQSCPNTLTPDTSANTESIEMTSIEIIAQSPPTTVIPEDYEITSDPYSADTEARKQLKLLKTRSADVKFPVNLNLINTVNDLMINECINDMAIDDDQGLDVDEESSLPIKRPWQQNLASLGEILPDDFRLNEIKQAISAPSDDDNHEFIQ